MAARTLLEVDEQFHAAGAVGAPIWSSADLIDHPHVLARDMVLKAMHETLGEVSVPGIVPKLSRTPGTMRHLGLEPGASNDSVLADLLGLSSEDIAALKTKGVI
jgi:crotonobetainyl-CoA:carnitine CoA-transferase CaiB-like acyl-CoA transferase